MASWVLNFTRGGAKHKKQMPQQARLLLEIGLWGVPPTAQAKDKLAPGDRVLAYVGAPDRIFAGEAVIAEGWHEWTPDEVSLYPMTSTFSAGIALTGEKLWNKPVPLLSVWPKTEGAKTNPSALWYGAAVRIVDSDYDLIADAAVSGGLSVAASTSVAASQPAPLAPAPTASAVAPVVGDSTPVTPAAATPELPESAPLFAAVRRLRRFLDEPKTINEASTRAFFLDKYVDALGYTEFDDVEHGSAVLTGDYPDYILKAGGSPVMAVEAKKIGHPLGPKEAGQLVKYCSVLGLRWGLLTDGRYLQIYDAPVTGMAPEERLVLEIDLNDWADREDFDVRRWPEAALITKEAMSSGEALERFAARELIRMLLGDTSSRTVKALRSELQTKKVMLTQQQVGELVRELLM